MWRMGVWSWMGLSLTFVAVSGCTDFVAADPVVDSESSTGLTAPGSTGAEGPGPASTTAASESADGTESASSDPEPDPSESETGDSDSDASGSTSGAPPSSTSGPDPSSTGGESSTGEVAKTCADLVLPDQLATTCSLEATDFASLSIDNDCLDVAVDVYWVDYGCNEIFFARIDAGGNWGIESFQTHPWRLRNVDTGVLMREIPPLAGDTTLGVLQR